MHHISKIRKKYENYDGQLSRVILVLPLLLKIGDTVVEAKSDKFKRLAEARVNKAIACLRSIGKLSNRGHYEYSEEEIRKIFQSLKKELEDARSEFEIAIARESKNNFRLKD